MKDLNLLFASCCKVYGMQPMQVLADSRKAELIEVRRAFAYAAYYMTAATDDEIADFLQRDRSNNIHHRERFAELLYLERDTRAKFAEIKRNFLQRKKYAA